MRSHLEKLAVYFIRVKIVQTNSGAQNLQYTKFLSWILVQGSTKLLNCKTRHQYQDNFWSPWPIRLECRGLKYEYNTDTAFRSETYRPDNASTSYLYCSSHTTFFSEDGTAAFGISNETMAASQFGWLTFHDGVGPLENVQHVSA